MKRAALALVLTLAAASAAHAQTPPRKKTPPATVAKPLVQKAGPMAAMRSLPPLKEMRPGLEAKAKVRTDAATTTAMAAVPDGAVETRTIEERGGRLIYAFRIRTADKSPHDVIVDAMTGKIVPMRKSAAKKKRLNATAPRARDPLHRAHRAARAVVTLP